MTTSYYQEWYKLKDAPELRRALPKFGLSLSRTQLCAVARTMGSMWGHVRLARLWPSMAADDNGPPAEARPATHQVSGAAIVPWNLVKNGENA